MQYSHDSAWICHLHVGIYVLPKRRHCEDQPDRWKKQTDGNRYCPRELSPTRRSSAAFNDVDGVESCSVEIFARQFAQLEMTLLGFRPCQIYLPKILTHGLPQLQQHVPLLIRIIMNRHSSSGRASRYAGHLQVNLSRDKHRQSKIEDLTSKIELAVREGLSKALLWLRS